MVFFLFINFIYLFFNFDDLMIIFVSIQRRAVYLNAEVDEGMKQWHERKEMEKQKEEHVKSLLLKPKGNVLLKNKK